MIKGLCLILAMWAGTQPAFATTFVAKVEGGNTVIILSHAATPEQCRTAVHFKFTDPKEPEKRQDGVLLCPSIRLKPGESREMCRGAFPVTNIELATPVDATCDL